MDSDYLIKALPFLELFASPEIDNKVFKFLLKKTKIFLIKALIEVAYNVSSKQPTDPEAKQFEGLLKYLTNRKVSLQKKKQFLLKKRKSFDCIQWLARSSLETLRRLADYE